MSLKCVLRAKARTEGTNEAEIRSNGLPEELKLLNRVAKLLIAAYEYKMAVKKAILCK